MVSVALSRLLIPYINHLVVVDINIYIYIHSN